MTLLLDLAFIPKVHKPVTDQESEETHIVSSLEELTLFISETTGSNRSDVTTDNIELSFILELTDASALLPHPSRLYL